MQTKTHNIKSTGTTTLERNRLAANKVMMNIPVALAALLSCVLIALLSGCELDADADMEDGTSGADASDDTADVAPEPMAYRFVRVSDLSTKSGTINGGADIDAVLLTKRDGRQYAARTVEGYAHGGGRYEGPELNPSEALGFPDSFYNWPDSSRCDVDRGYVSLGGQGGYLIVGMDADIDSGDRITVAEVGGCQYSGGTAIAESVRVEVAVSRDIDAQWMFVGSGTGPVIQATVPTLPERFDEPATVN